MRKADAAAELLRRRKARAHIRDFTLYTFPDYRMQAFHRQLCEYLQAVIEGRITRLMVFAPPQHGKSELVSVRLPAFWLAKRPEDPVILTSYGGELAQDKSRQVRDILTSPEYQALFPGLRLRQDDRAAARWRLEGHRGGMLAAGTGGPVTGRGALLGIIDDPFASWEDAQSPTIREKTWDWYRGTFRTRIREGGAIILIMTRWHEDDLAGRLMQAQAGQWIVLRYPALAESQEDRDENNRHMGLPLGEPDPLRRKPGEALAPRLYSAATLREIRDELGAMVFGAEYQGSPRAPEGHRIKRDMLPIVDAAPAVGQRVRYWDMAASTKTGAKRTAGVLLCYTPDGRTVVEDVVAGQWETDARKRVMRQTAELDALKYGNTVKVWFEQEPGSSGLDVARDLIKLLADFPVEADKVTGDKDVRLEPFIAQAQAGNVSLVRGLWNQLYIDELVAIPNGFYRDQADATAGAYNKVPKERQAYTASTAVSRQAVEQLLG